MFCIFNSLIRTKPLRFLRKMSDAANNHHIKNDFFVWVDLEMTGLDVDKHKIVEVACLLTTPQLDIIHDGLHLVVHQPQEVFDNECDEWPLIHHGQSGLIEESLKSEITVEKADELVSSYIKTHTDYECNSGTYHLAGNSVYMDKMFINKYMPLTHEILHYNIVDVSSIRKVFTAWFSHRMVFEKNKTHRALDDIQASLSELRFYREKLYIY